MPLGILFGFLAALFQSVSYLCSRLFIRRHKNDTMTLLAVSHIIIGIVSLPLAVFLKPAVMPAFAIYRNALLGTAIFYLLGQVFLFAALVKTEASRVSPLLGLKIIILASISVLFLHQSLTPTQWAAVALSTVAAVLLSNTGQRLTLWSVLLILLACLFYSLSDLNIKLLVDHFTYLGVFRGAMLSTSLTYIFCGIIGAVIVIFKRKSVSRQTIAWSLPFAFSWLLAIIFLYFCFALIGVIFGNILQSTRGIISMLFGYALAHSGMENLEPKMTRPIYLKRIAAAILMTAAVALYLL